MMSIYTRDAASVCFITYFSQTVTATLGLTVVSVCPIVASDIKYKHYQMKLKSHQTKTQILVVFNCIRYIWYYQYTCNDFIYLFCMVLFFATLVHIPVHNFQLCDYRQWNRGRLHNPQNRLCHTFQLHILQKITN